MSGKGDEELLNGLSTTGAYGQQTRDRPPEKAQKHILGVQGQNQGWQISTGISTGGECGQQGRLMQNYWNRRKAKGNEGTVTKDTENLNCSAPSVSQNSLPRFFLGPSSLQESSYRKQNLSCGSLEPTEHKSVRLVGHMQGAEGAVAIVTE